MPQMSWRDDCQDGNNMINSVATFQARASQVLGEQEFIQVASFFCDVIQKCADFQQEPYLVAFITRRCGILFKIFLEYFEACLEAIRTNHWEAEENMRSIMDQLKDINLQAFEQRCVTDTNLLSLSVEMIEYYQKYHKHINLIVVDELLIHGRALNLFLMDLEKKVLQQLNMDDEQGSQQFLKHLFLYVFTQSSDVLLLLMRYRECLYSYRILERVAWRDLSARFARLIAVSPVNNASYSWSVRVPLMQEQEGYPLYEQQCGSFCYYLTGIQSTREDNFIYLYPSASCTKAICTVRTKRSLIPFCGGSYANKKSQLYVPYIMLDHLSMENIVKLHRKIIEDVTKSAMASFDKILTRSERYSQQMEQDPKKCYRWLAETNELILSYLLFRRFAKQVLKLTEDEMEQYAQYVDWGLLSWNYKWIESGDDEQLKIYDAKEELRNIWKWRPEENLLEEYLDILLKDVPPIWEGEIFGPVQYLNAGQNKMYCKNVDDPVVVAVHDAISQIGYEVEKNAYERFISGAMFNDKALSHWGEYYSIRDFLLECKNTFEDYPQYYEGPPVAADLYQVLAVILQSMDLGLIGMNPLYGQVSHQTNQEEQFYTMLKAGEQALFIWPIRYQKFIPTLLEMIEKWSGKAEDIKIDLARFAQAYTERVSETLSNYMESDADKLFCQLWRFLKILDTSGLTLKEWRFRLCRTQGLDTQAPWDAQMTIENSDIMVKDWLEQRKSLNIYRMT